MDLRDLEKLLDVEYDQIKGEMDYTLPREKWKHLIESVDSTGVTLLMQAARDGAWECVDLLLRCGSEVNALDKKKRRALDYSVGGNHHEVTLLLLQWDSLLTHMEGEGQNGQGDTCGNDAIRQLFTQRDKFHKGLKDGESKSLEGTIKGTCGAPRYLVNSRGESALYTAARHLNYAAWAWLRSLGFEYSTKDEKEDMRAYECNEGFARAIGWYFVDIPGCHIQRMVWKSKVYKTKGMDEISCGTMVERYFKEIDKVKFGSEILQTLQDDPSLQIILDFSSTGIECIKPMGKQEKIWGLAELELNRIYVGANETEEFDYSDVVSNLTHELAHKTLAVVFENGGLPYKKVDIDAQEEYQDVICNMMCDAYSKKPDEIIQRALRSLNVYHELIVRVPEIIVKYNVPCAGSDAAEDGFIRLQREAPELLDFYEKRVVPEIENYIKSNITANKCVIRDLLRTPALLTSYCDEEIQVMKEIDPAPTSKLHEMHALRVSNLKLGVSHLKLSLKEVAFVNWAKYQKTRIFFAKALNRNEIKTLVIIWDEEKKPDFCRRSICNCDCIEKKIGDIATVTILIVPKKFHVCVCEENSFGYKWSDLSGRTKYWLLKKKLNVGGNSMKLRDIVGCYGGNEERDHMMHELLDEDDISMLINQKSIYVGRPLKSLLKEKGGELAGKTPDWYIPRSIMIRNMQFSKEVFYARKSDVFIIKNARKSDLERVGIEEACIWDENSAPFEMRCFILTGRRHQEKEDIIFQSIFEKLHNLICQECTGKKWDFIHFFEFKDNIYFHLHSLHLMVIPKSTRYQYSGIDILDCSKIESPLIIADIPGSGKSVFVRETALQMTRKHPNCWIELVELQLFEKIFEEWNESEFISDGNEMDCLYQLIKSSESEFEKKIFNHLCKEKMKFIIIFDGLDEICPKYKEVITSFLEALVSRRNVKVCLTTRTYEMADVEKRLETISFRFLPFSRADQLKYFNNQWNALLRFTPNDKQETKIKAIADNLPVESEISRQIQNFTNEEVGSGTVNFDELAAELIEIGKSMVEGEGNFTATPLHCWMIATVAFEDNFDLNTFKYLPDLYKAFVDIKIRLYCKEKAKEPGLVAGDSLLEGHRSLQYKRLKRFSAYFFLQDKDWELKKEDTDDMLRVGLLTQEGESITFVHRTIGEYLFTLWLLEKAHKERVTSVWMSRVLLEKGFEKVRLFLDSLLRVENEKKSGRGQGEQVKVPYLNQSAFPRREEFLISLQKCMFKCILECNGGIFLYLAENSKAMLPDVIFKEARWDMKILDIEIDRHDENRRWNTLTLCGECIRGRMGMRNSSASHSEFEYLKFLQHMLKMIEEHKLVGHLKEFISNYGLQWMGVDEADLWEEGEGIAQFKLIFEFLVRNKGVLGKILWDTVLGEKGEELLKNSAEYAFDIFEYILESMVEGEQWKESLLEGGNILEAWMCVVRRSGKDGLGRMWWFLEEKLEAVRGGKRRFLRKKDRKNGNALYTACCNESDPNVLPFVWELVRKEFVDEECKDLIFDSFNGVEQNYNFVKNVFHVWLFGLLQEGFLDIDEASHMLHSRNHKDECYLLSFNWHPRSLQKLQELLCTERLRPMDIVKDMESNYMNLTGSCFHPEWIPSFYTDIPSSIVSEWETLLPSLESSPLVDAVPQFDQHGFIPHLSYWDGERFDGFRLKAFLVLLNRKLRLEERILGREELLKRVKGDWFLTHSFFPEMRTRREEEGKTTRAFLIPFFFALISKFLPKERVAEILLHHDSYFGTIFHISLLEGDPMAFLSYYDVARWSMGDRDALWRVHSTFWRGVRGEENTLLEFLLWAQEAAFFTFSENDGCDNQEDLSRSHDVVSCSREESDVEYAEGNSWSRDG